MEKHSDSTDKKAYLIRNLNRIEDRTEFFELIRSTDSKVTCTPDGLSINDKITIAPEAYSQIGKSVFNDKIQQISEYQKSDFTKQLTKQFNSSVPADRREEFQNRLKEVQNLPEDQQRAEVRRIVNELRGNGPALGDQQFENSWNTAATKCQQDVNTEITNLVNNLKEGTGENAQEDFNRLKNLAVRKLEGTITDNEQKQLQEQVDKCSRHRKENFFQTTANHRSDLNYDQAMDNVEKEFSGGKTLEQWKVQQQELERNHRNGDVDEQNYRQQRREIENGIENAKDFRDFRDKADRLIHDEKQNFTGNQLKERYVNQCQQSVNNLRGSEDQNAIAEANRKLAMANRINNGLNSEFIDTNKSFKTEVKTFTSSQNERLCYNIDVDQVKHNLRQIYEQPNIEDIKFSETIDNVTREKRIFNDMKIGDYDRLYRVFTTYGETTKDIVTAASKVAHEPAFAKFVQTPNDIASIAEGIKKEIVSFEFKFISIL